MRDPFSVKNTISSGPAAGRVEDISYEESTDRSTGLSLRPNSSAVSRARLLLLLVFACVAVLAGRLYYLAIVKHDYYRALAEGNRLRVEYLPAPRGLIYDSRGQVIAGNRPSFELVVSPLDLSKDGNDRAAAVSKIAAVINVPAEEIAALLDSEAARTQFQSVLIKQNLNRDEALILQEQAPDLPGFRVQSVPIREYPAAEAVAHLIGYVGKLTAEEYRARAAEGYRFNDAIGRSGVEQVYEPLLRGSFGQRQVEVDAAGAVKRIFGEKPSQPGRDLILNIDLELQVRLYAALERELSAIGRKKAAALAMNPQSGRLLAYASLPGFDGNLFASGISIADYQKLVADKNQPLFDRAIRGTYPPGSTIKPVVAAAALEAGEIGEHTKIDDTGFILVPNPYGGPDYYFYGYNRAGLGVVDVRRAIALSSDIFFYAVGGGYEKIKLAGLGISRLADYYRRFHLDQKLGIDLPGESAGLVPTPQWKKEQWYLGDTYHVAIGQGDLLVTPLHVLSWISAIANGGRIYEPQIARKEPKVVGELGISEKNLQIVREGMRQAVTDGTAKSLQSVPVAVAGKTGTAQFDARALYRAHAWFAGYAPADDPQIAIVVLIEDGGEGSTTAVPVAREVLTWWSKNRN